LNDENIHSLFDERNTCRLDNMAGFKNRRRQGSSDISILLSAAYGYKFYYRRGA
jgi:hypothetical protein